jgi:hypothetical protein
MNNPGNGTVKNGRLATPRLREENLAKAIYIKFLYVISHLTDSHNSICCYNCTFQKINRLTLVKGMPPCPFREYPLKSSIPFRWQPQVRICACRLHTLPKQREKKQC